MAKKTKKLTTFKSSESVVTENYMNSIYGGLHGTDKEALYSTTDPLIHGHVHDGEHADGHAQKINLGQHVTGLLPQAMIEGTLDSGRPGSPLNSIQFNSGDTFAGTPSFLFESSTDNLQLSKDKRFYYGSIDNQNSYYIGHEINSDPDLIFGSESTADSINYRFRNAATNTTDVILEFAPSAENVYLYGESSVSRRFYLGNVTRSFNPWDLLYTRGVRLFHQAETLNQKHVTLATGIDQVDDYSLLFPIYNPSSTNMVLKTVTSGSSIKLTWDNYSSGGGSSYFQGQNINITVNNTIETESSVIFNTVESDMYYIGETDAFIKGDGSVLTSLINFGVNGTTEMVLDSQHLYPHLDQGLDLGSSTNRYSSLHVDDIVINDAEVRSINSNDLILEANDGTNGSIVTLEYSADNTTDIVLETKGRGYLKTPYKNVMSEGHDGSPAVDVKSSFLNFSTIAKNEGSNQAVLKVEVLNQLTYGMINFDIVAAKINSTSTIADLGFAKNYLLVKRDNPGVNTTYQKLHPVGEFIDSTPGEERFKSMNGQISNILMTVDSIVGGTSDTQTFNVVLQYTRTAESGADDPCHFTITVKTTHVDGINIYRPI